MIRVGTCPGQGISECSSTSKDLSDCTHYSGNTNYVSWHFQSLDTPWYTGTPIGHQACATPKMLYTTVGVNALLILRISGPRDFSRWVLRLQSLGQDGLGSGSLKLECFYWWHPDFKGSQPGVLRVQACSLDLTGVRMLTFKELWTGLQNLGSSEPVHQTFTLLDARISVWKWYLLRCERLRALAFPFQVLRACNFIRNVANLKMRWRALNVPCQLLAFADDVEGLRTLTKGSVDCYAVRPYPDLKGQNTTSKDGFSLQMAARFLFFLQHHSLGRSQRDPEVLQLAGIGIGDSKKLVTAA